MPGKTGQRLRIGEVHPPFQLPRFFKRPFSEIRVLEGLSTRARSGRVVEATQVEILEQAAFFPYHRFVLPLAVPARGWRRPLRFQRRHSMSQFGRRPEMPIREESFFPLHPSPFSRYIPAAFSIRSPPEQPSPSARRRSETKDLSSKLTVHSTYPSLVPAPFLNCVRSPFLSFLCGGGQGGFSQRPAGFQPQQFRQNPQPNLQRLSPRDADSLCERRALGVG